MNIKNPFKLNRPTRFHYTPRYYKGVEGENAYKFKSKYRKDEIGENFNDYRAHWNNERDESRVKGNYVINKRLIIIAFVLILLFLFLIEFDLSIFKLK
jgi:hypothetical protein